MTRRSLLVQGGVGALGLVALTSGGKIFADAPRAETPAGGPRLGAFYTLGYRHHGASWSKTPEVPSLGFYDSGSRGTIDAHLSMARLAGLSFFVVAVPPAGPARDDARELLVRSPRFDFQVAPLIEPDEDSSALVRARRSRVLSDGEYVHLAADWLSKRFDDLRDSGWFGQSACLRGSDGRSVAGFVRWDDPLPTLAVVEELFRRRPSLADNHRFWFAGTQDVATAASALVKASLAGYVSWFPLQPELGDGWDRSLSLYRKLGVHGEHRLIAVSPSFDSPDHPARAPRDEGARLMQRLRAVEDLDPAPTHIVVTSFNDWRNRTAIEPSARAGQRYLRVLADWSTAMA